jgi:hypothetical protein
VRASPFRHPAEDRTDVHRSARQLQVDHLDFYEDVAAVHTLMQRSRISARQLEAYGIFSVSIGVNVKSPTKTIQYTETDPSLVANVFRSIPSTWDSLEATNFYSPLDVYFGRLNHFFSADVNTCAFDVAYTMVLSYAVYLIQRDRMTPAMKAALSPPARLLYDLCTQRSLHQRKPEEHARIRSQLAWALNKHDPKTHKLGKFIEMIDVFKDLFKGTPQFSWHEIHANLCCDGKPQIFPNRKVLTQCFISTGKPAAGMNVGQIIQRRFSQPTGVDMDFNKAPIPLATYAT